MSLYCERETEREGGGHVSALITVARTCVNAKKNSMTVAHSDALLCMELRMRVARTLIYYKCSALLVYPDGQRENLVALSGTIPVVIRGLDNSDHVHVAIAYVIFKHAYTV